MAELEKFKDNYSDIFFVDEINNGKIYRAYNKIEDKEVCLKVIDKEQLKLGDYDFLLKQLKREEEITEKCESENTVKLYQKMETQNSIIFEFEYCDKDLYEYLEENGELSREPEFFKNIILKIAKVLKDLYDKGIIHRDIKPSNIFLKSEEDKNSIKLGDFGCAIYKKDNKYEPIGTILYSAPEIIQNYKYDEKCDLWSLGVTLYELYFGKSPYGSKVDANKIIDIISSPEDFIFRMSRKPCLDILFKRLLEIEPEDRISFNEFFNYVFN